MRKPMSLRLRVTLLCAALLTLCGGNRRPEACHRHVAGQSAYNV